MTGFTASTYLHLGACRRVKARDPSVSGAPFAKANYDWNEHEKRMKSGDQIWFALFSYPMCDDLWWWIRPLRHDTCRAHAGPDWLRVYRESKIEGRRPTRWRSTKHDQNYSKCGNRLATGNNFQIYPHMQYHAIPCNGQGVAPAFSYGARILGKTRVAHDVECCRTRSQIGNWEHGWIRCIRLKMNRWTVKMV